MKKLVSILVFSAGLFATSCQKENIQPTVVPTAVSPQQELRGMTTGTPSTDSGTTDTNITDPNHDPDANKKKNK
jgi:uncharacterized lipoprotein YajG